MPDRMSKDEANSESPEGDELCYACGGPVGADGKYYKGGEVGPKGNSDSGPKDDDGRNGQDAFDSFARALLRRASRGL
jgi:hypothetical protein